MAQPTRVEYLIVGGGGGGGSGLGSGAGAGAFKEGTGYLTQNVGAITITIGSGGNGGTQNSVSDGANGSDTTLSNSTSGTITCNGGAGGTSVGAAKNGLSNSNGSGSGAGGGGTTSLYLGGGTPSGPGNEGGYVNGRGSMNSGANGNGSAGGGGAGGVGRSFNQQYGSTNLGFKCNGGDGLNRWADGTFRTYATGGGAGAYPGGLVNNPGLGGSGGGSKGGDGSTDYSATPVTNQNGLANTGGGGGGAAYGVTSPNRGQGGNGGSGVVIIRYPNIFDAATSTTGSPTITTHQNYRIYKFTASGTITFT